MGTVLGRKKVTDAVAVCSESGQVTVNKYTSCEKQQRTATPTHLNWLEAQDSTSALAAREKLSVVAVSCKTTQNTGTVPLVTRVLGASKTKEPLKHCVDYVFLQVLALENKLEPELRFSTLSLP